MKYNPNSVAFDLETEGLNKNIILERTKPYPEFDPSSVKTGDCRTEAEVDDKIHTARLKHQEEEQAYFQRAIERGALAAETGRILTIAYLPVDSGQPTVDFEEDEAVLLRRFWAGYRKVVRDGGLLIGHNIKNFDLPFLCRRSIICGVPIPQGVIRGRYFSDTWLDTMDVWAFGEFKRFITLDLLGQVLGVGAKSDQDVTGAEFAKFWRAGGDKRDLAWEYAALDVILVRDIYRKFCAEV